MTDWAKYKETRAKINELNKRIGKLNWERDQDKIRPLEKQVQQLNKQALRFSTK